jgi:hypothetical protein
VLHTVTPGAARTRSVSTISLALALLAVAPAVAGSATPPAPVAPVEPLPPVAPPGAPAIAPAELQAIEDKMAQLQITSERYTLRVQGSFRSTTVTVGGKGTCPAKGKCRPIQRRRVTRGRPRQLDVTRRTEADLVAGVGEAFDARGRPQLIIAGANLYLYAPERRGRARMRPWLHQVVKRRGGGSPLAFVLPFSGQGSQETSLGGAGPYARLINLLRTATAPVATAGAATVAGQQTTELIANVVPGKLVAGIPPKELRIFEKLLPAQHLQIFVNASGLPLRIVVANRIGASSLTQTTDLLAINTPVTVKVPAASRTRPFPRDLDTVFHVGNKRRAKSKQ